MKKPSKTTSGMVANSRKEAAVSKGLSEAFIAQLVASPKGQEGFHFDGGTGGVQGLYARVSDAGKVTYGIRYAMPGKPRSTKALERNGSSAVTVWPSLEDARDAARKLLRQIEKDGISPKFGQECTCRAVFEYYVNGLKTGDHKHTRQGEPASAKTIECVESAWATHFDHRFGDLHPAKLTASAIAIAFKEMGHKRKLPQKKGRGSRWVGGKKGANRAMTYFHAAWTLSAHTGMTAGLKDPFEGLQKNHEEDREELIQDHQFAAFEAALQEEDQSDQAYWLASLLQGNRGGELKKLLWDDVDFDTGEIWFRNTKNHRTHLVEMTEQMQAILESLPRGEPDDWVFAGAVPRASWERIKEKAGLQHLIKHDLRRTFGTMLAAAGWTAPQIGAALNQKAHSTPHKYIKLAARKSTIKGAMQAQANLIGGLMSNVVPIRKKAA